ncbi:hypothetical protein A8F94_01045 [Bacillus sp. FJAT-27225]|nr:hypothetical protein A8F94_01045 [Bacillus sp. FJAT-27225]
MAIALSILALVCLAQNYTQSLIPEANDGISISNSFAYAIIGENQWSQSMFKHYFEGSAYLTLFLMVLFPIVLALETRMTKKTT